MADPGEFSLLLLGRFPGKDKAVAQALARAFNRDESWGLQVVGASPITMITGLTQVQAQAVYANLNDVEQAGCRFQVQQGVDASTPQIGWPDPPRIHGRTIAEMVGGGPAPAPASISGSRPANIVEVSLPCPYTGKPLILKIALLAAEGAVQAGIPVAVPIAVPVPSAVPVPVPMPMAPQRKTPAVGTSVPVPIPVPRPAAPAPRGVTASPIPIPVPIPMPGNPGQSRSVTAQIKPAQAPRPRVPTPGGGSPAIMPEDFEEIQPVESIPIAAAAPAARMPEPLPPPKPLPEVPMLDGQVRPAAVPVAGVDPRLSGPLDMSAFESALKTDGRPARASGIRAAVQLPAPKPSPEAGAPKAGAGNKGKGKG